MGHLTQRQYDPAGNLISIIDPLGNKTQYNWDGENKLVQVIDALMRTRSYHRDAMGRLVQAVNPLGHTTWFEYDQADRLTAKTNPDGKRIDYGYNALDQLNSRSFDDITESIAYDAAGKRLSISGPSATETYHYDAAGNLTALTNETLNQSVSFSYNANNQLINRTDPTNGEWVQFERNSLGQVSKISRDNQMMAELDWDELGQLAKRTYANGTRDKRVYDALGRVVGIARQSKHHGDDDDWDDDKDEDDDDDWDDDEDDDDDDDFLPLSGPFPGDRFIYPVVDTHLSKVLKNSVYGLKRTVKAKGWNTKELYAWFYDAVGNVKGQYRHHHYDHYGYDANDRLINENKGYSKKKRVHYAYDTVGNRTWQKLGGKETSYTYNDADQLVQENGWRRVKKANSHGNLSNGKLKQVEIEYGYDPNGNLSTTGWANYREQYTHDGLGRITAIQNSYTDGSDWLSRRYTYDSLDRRISRVHSGYGLEQTTFQTLYARRQVLAELDQNLNPTRSLTQQPDGLYGELIHQTMHNVPGTQGMPSDDDDDDDDDDEGLGYKLKRAKSLWFHQNSQGSTVELTDSKGKKYDRFRYSSFGQVDLYSSDDDKWDDDDEGHGSWKKHLNTTINPYLLLGKETDLATGLTQLDARTYNPNLGRFIQPDIFNFANLALPKSARAELLQYTGLSTNVLLLDPSQQMRYGYVSGNPLRWVDPFGLCDPPKVLDPYQAAKKILEMKPGSKKQMKIDDVLGDETIDVTVTKNNPTEVNFKADTDIDTWGVKEGQNKNMDIVEQDDESISFESIMVDINIDYDSNRIPQGVITVDEAGEDPYNYYF